VLLNVFADYIATRHNSRIFLYVRGSFGLECSAMNFDEYVASIPGLLATFEAAHDSVLIPLTKASIRYRQDLPKWEEIITQVDRFSAIADWYRKKFRAPEEWAFVLEALSLTDLTPSSPQNDDDLFDALMSLEWEELDDDMRSRMKAVGFDPEVIKGKPTPDIVRRIRTSFGSYGLDRMPSLALFSEQQLWDWVRVLSIGHAYPRFKDRIRSILIEGIREREEEYA
jgi:hypothetical protein